MVRANVYKACILAHIVDPVRESSWDRWIWKVVPTDFDRLLGGSPLLALVFVIPNQFFIYAS